MLSLKVFISAPNDVREECTLAIALLRDELPYDPLLAGQVTFDIVSWVDPFGRIPMPANLSPQEAVMQYRFRPSESDIFIVILWGRLGMNLDITKFQKPDGARYESGTEFEFEDAWNANPKGSVRIFVCEALMVSPALGV
jgi:hypothetical protein